MKADLSLSVPRPVKSVKVLKIGLLSFCLAKREEIK